MLLQQFQEALVVEPLGPSATAVGPWGSTTVWSVDGTEGASKLHGNGDSGAKAASGLHGDSSRRPCMGCMVAAPRRRVGCTENVGKEATHGLCGGSTEAVATMHGDTAA